MTRTRIIAMTLACLASALPPTSAAADDGEQTLVDLECDPFPFATGGYGCQAGVRHRALRGVRISVASFAVNVPDIIAEIGGNEGFDLRVRPSLALYVLYYFSPAGRDGLAVGGAMRYLRLRYRHDAFPGEEATTSELSPEAIVAYQWHPFRNRFYVQPWLGLSVTAVRDGEAVVGDNEYDALPVQPFVTVNIGWELRL